LAKIEGTYGINTIYIYRMEDNDSSVSEVVGDVPSTVTVYPTFDEMELHEDILRGVYGIGFQKPSAIQQRGIVPIKDGRDILAQAQSGTGKTGTFIIGAATRVDPSLKKVQILVLAPVRELAQQIEHVAKDLTKYMNNKAGLNVYSATGGTPLRDDIRAIEKGCQILIGTPGRIFDLMNRNVLSRASIRVLILDEADQMLEDRFKEQIMCILEKGFPTTTQVALFSATMDTDVLDVAKNLLRNPVRILVDAAEVPLDGIKQLYVELEKEEWKFEVLCDLYQQLNISQALVYCNKRQRADWLADKMRQNGFPLSVIHGEMSVDERKARMSEFRSGAVRVMISTDMLARGIDVQQVSLVINYELPVKREDYIHRIGRAGRFGRKGVTINLIAPEDKQGKTEIEEHWKITMELLPQDLARVML
jgi:translation initiation factor 4A